MVQELNLRLLIRLISCLPCRFQNNRTDSFVVVYIEVKIDQELMLKKLIFEIRSNLK